MHPLIRAKKLRPSLLLYFQTVVVIPRQSHKVLEFLWLLQLLRERSFAHFEPAHVLLLEAVDKHFRMLESLVFPDRRDHVMERQKVEPQCLGQHVAGFDPVLAAVVVHKGKHCVLVVNLEIVGLQQAVDAGHRQRQQPVFNRLPGYLEFVGLQ